MQYVMTFAAAQAPAAKVDAAEKAKKKHPHYSDHEAWATELEIDGYVIVAYDKKEYEREQKIKEVLDGE
jgi:hypothetical protein